MCAGSLLVIISLCPFAPPVCACLQFQCVRMYDTSVIVLHKAQEENDSIPSLKRTHARTHTGTDHIGALVRRNPTQTLCRLQQISPIVTQTSR